MYFVIVLLVLTAIVVFVTLPLRRQRAVRTVAAQRAFEADRLVSELEARRDAKYREIRDAELDHGTGKLSDADFGALDATLRAEAVEILKALDGACERQAEARAQAGDRDHTR